MIKKLCQSGLIFESLTRGGAELSEANHKSFN